MDFSLTTIELSAGADFDLLAHLPENPTSFIRGGQGIVGWGEALRLTSTGPDRIGSLAKQWSELVSKFEIKDELRLPGTGLVAFGSIAFADESSAQSVLVVPKVILGTRDGRTWLTKVEDASANDAAANGAAAIDFWLTEATYDRNPSVEFRIGEHTPQEFRTAVRDAVENIRAGKLEKVVLARDLVAELAPYFDLRPVLERLAKKYPTCWVYSVDGMFGASPELLVRVSHGQVSARVLAGTAGRGTDPGVDAAIATALAASAKNTFEHAFAVDSLVNALAPFCSQVDADPKPFSLALPNLWHLASDVHGVLLESASVLDLAAALHPTAAVAGTPRLEAQKLLAELEDFDRGRYAGPVGWIGADGDGEWAIALRGAQIEGRTVRAFAGCGIVEGSEPDAELAETELKFAPMREALG